MTRICALASSVFAVGILLSAPQGNTGNLEVAGQWTLTPAQETDQVQLTLQWKSARHTMNSTMQWSLSRIEGLSPQQLKADGTPVQFRIAREAGTLNCEGYLKRGSGGGVFTLTVNPNFVAAMESLGFRDLSNEQRFALVIHDVTTSYVRDIRAEGVDLNRFDELLAMRIHDVTVAYIREMKQSGLQPLSGQKLIAMRIHKVTPEFARDLKRLGYPSVSADQLIAMRIHGASLEFVRELEALGYKNPAIEKLIAMRIHGVTPDRIRKLQARGMKNLSIDQLISMRIHGLVE